MVQEMQLHCVQKYNIKTSITVCVCVVRACSVHTLITTKHVVHTVICELNNNIRFGSGSGGGLGGGEDCAAVIASTVTTANVFTTPLPADTTYLVLEFWQQPC